MSSPRTTEPLYDVDDRSNENDNACSISQDSERTLTPQRTPLPIRQLAVLCLIRFSGPISFYVIFPFVNQMIEEIGVTDDPKAVGYYSGLVEGLFALAQFCTVYFWGALSDKIGRRPVLILGLCGIVVSTVLFGLSTSFPMMLIARMLGGALSGNVAVVKSVVGEITDETNQAAAFSYIPLAWSLGALVAPALGGFLSHPVERYPSIFRSVTLFREHPFLLPCLVGAGFSAAGLVAAYLFLEESLAEKRPKHVSHSEQSPLLSSSQKTQRRSYSACSSSRSSVSTVPDEATYSNREILSVPAVQKVLMSYGFMTLVTVMIDAVFVLWLYTPMQLGGLGFSSAEIGGALTLFGILTTVIAVIVFPPLERRVGATLLFQVGMTLQVVTVVTFPLGHVVAQAWGKGGAYTGVGTVLVIRSVAGIVFACNMILITRAAPSRRALGMVNGLAQMASSAARAVGPGVANSLFAFSIKSRIWDGNLVWFVLGLIGLFGVMVALRLPHDRRKPTPRVGSTPEAEARA